MQDSSWKFKEEVAETAISLFKRDGYNNVTVNDICKACGISRSVFYSSFNGKRSILEYMVEKPQHNDDKSFMKFAHADNDFERIWQLFDRFITIAYDFGPELTSTLFIMQPSFHRSSQKSQALFSKARETRNILIIGKY